jgi:competence protein ComEC
LIPYVIALTYWLKLVAEPLGVGGLFGFLAFVALVWVLLHLGNYLKSPMSVSDKRIAVGTFSVVCFIGFLLPLVGIQNVGLPSSTHVYNKVAHQSPSTSNLKVVGSGWGFIDSAKQTFESQTKGVTNDARALVLGLSIGDDSSLSSRTSERLKILSLTHLSAVSGANCAIVLGGVLLLLKRVSIARSIRALISTLALVAYVLVVGAQPSVLRSAIMAGVVILSMAGGRKTPPLVALAWSVVLVLLLWPRMAGELGLLLSVASTAAILVLAPKLFERMRIKLPKWLAASLAVTVAAQLWCLPMLEPLQGGLPTYSVIANLLAEPLVAPVTVIGIVALICAAIGLPFAGVLTYCASIPAGLIVQIANLAELPVSTLWWPSGTLGFITTGCLVVSVSVYFFSRKRLALAVSSLLTILLGVTASSAARSFVSWPSDDWQVVACDVGQGDGLVVRSEQAIAVIDVGREPKPIDDCLQRLGVKNIDLLVLTHFDADHVAGLSGALRSRNVSLAMLTPFSDDRPLAHLSKKLLRDAAINIVTGECCMQGSLGSAIWQVVEPEPKARGSDDSNDGSITMTFKLNGLDLFTFADLGEKGQMRAVENHESLFTRRANIPLVVKVSHHGSADQYPELYEQLQPEVALFSVGARNPYGHPTPRTLRIFQNAASRILRTDLQGSISVSVRHGELVIGSSGRG